MYIQKVRPLTVAVAPAVDVVMEKIEAEPDGYAEDFKVYDNADDMLTNEEFDGIIIGTRCYMHTEIAINAMKKISLFFRKSRFV